MNSTENIECAPTGSTQPENVVKPENGTTKKCRKCQELKLRSEFNKQTRNKDGLGSYCKVCAQKMYFSYYNKHKKKILLAHRKDYKKYGHNWKSTRSQYQKLHRAEFRKYTHKYRDENRDKINKEVMVRYYKDPEFRLRKVIPSIIRKSLHGNKNNHHWETLVGYSLKELKLHLEKQFVDNMGWGNYGKWHIDHIKPISSFRITGPWCKEFKQCWALENLRPLWAFDNLSKGSKIL